MAQHLREVLYVGGKVLPNYKVIFATVFDNEFLESGSHAQKDYSPSIL